MDIEWISRQLAKSVIISESGKQLRLYVEHPVRIIASDGREVTAKRQEHIIEIPTQKGGIYTIVPV
ncbi:hypothetical protein D3C77_457730 [compost metagenome]